MFNFSFKCTVMIKSDNKIYQDMVRMMGIPSGALAFKDAFGGGTTKGQDDDAGEVRCFIKTTSQCAESTLNCEIYQ